MDPGPRHHLIALISYPPGMLRRRVLLAMLASALIGTACGGGGGGGGSQANAVIGPADEGIDGVMAIRVPENTHSDGVVAYELQPPAGGVHSSVWLNCGFYDEPSPDENLVHDLEHGAVWLAYSPDLAPADLGVIHDLARANEKIVATPYPDLAPGVAVVASAWARQLTLESVDDPRLSRFALQYIDGSQAPEAAATCLGSPLGSPIP